MEFFCISYIKRPEEQCLILKISITLQQYFLNQETSINIHGYRLYSSRESETVLGISLRILKIHSSGKAAARSIWSDDINLRFPWFCTATSSKWPFQNYYGNFKDYLFSK